MDFDSVDNAFNKCYNYKRKFLIIMQPFGFQKGINYVKENIIKGEFTYEKVSTNYGACYGVITYIVRER